MRRTWIVGLTALGLALAAGLAQASNTDKKVKLRVTRHDGTSVRGTLKWKAKHLEVRSGRKHKIPYGDISEIRAAPLPSDEELLKTYEKKKAALGKADAKAWLSLAGWAEELGLEDAAAECFEKVLETEPDNGRARQGLGELKDADGKWVPAGPVLTARRAKLKPDDKDGLVELARYCLKQGQRRSGLDLAIDVLVQDTFHEGAKAIVRPFARDYRQATRPFRFPLAGRWKASEDRTRHHQLKAYAFFALDLMKVDARGRLHKGKGKKLKDWYTWDEPFYAVAPGTVVEVRNDFPDNPIGKIGNRHEKHNGVSLDHGNGEISWYVHAKKGSIAVKLGERVQAGQLLGRVGNSGGSAAPHLHFTLVAHRRVSVPWRCDSFNVIAPDGTPVPVRDAWPREGWTIEAPKPEPPKEPEEPKTEEKK